MAALRSPSYCSAGGSFPAFVSVALAPYAPVANSDRRDWVPAFIQDFSAAPMWAQGYFAIIFDRQSRRAL